MSKELYKKLEAGAFALSEIMSSVDDALIEREIIKESKSKIILELGAGTGAWCAWINTQVSDLTYYMTEEFSYTTVERQKQFIRKSDKISWPTNPEELHKTINILTENLPFNYTIFDKDYYFIKHKIVDQIDYARIDCDSNHIKEILKYLIQHGSEKLIITIDDCKPNAAINRLLVLTEFIHSGELKMLWAGKERMSFCRTSCNFNDVVERINEKEYFNSYIWDNFPIAGKDQFYLVTKMFNL